jgi:predicted RNA-binding protein with PIN domain
MILIDGHNLIPKIRGLSLRLENDETELIQILQDYCRATRKTVEVYFDGAPFDQAGSRKFGNVQAHFIRQGISADDMIIQRVRNMGKKAAHSKVVSSDQRIQREVHALSTDVLSSEEFAREIEKALTKTPGGGKPDPAKMSELEVEQWLKLFKNRPKP